MMQLPQPPQQQQSFPMMGGMTTATYPQPMWGGPMGAAPGSYPGAMMQPGMMQPGMMQPMRPVEPAQPVKPAAPAVPRQATMGTTSALKANIVQIAGCLDAQLGQDLDISGLPIARGAAKAGGACTNALQVALYGKDPNYTWRNLMVEMGQILRKSGYSQVPQLSCSHAIDLNGPVVVKPAAARRTKALLIGINYVGQGNGQLMGCHNDVRKMQAWATAQGFSPASMQILMDDGVSTSPTKANIWAALQWLVQGVQAGDALFFHFSGHGGQVKDVSGDETSGLDQTLIPVDHRTAGVILDDDVLAQILKPIPAGVDMFCVTDCCHSGTIMDLPYTVVVNAQTGAALNAGQIVNLGRNQVFHNRAAKRGDFMGVGGQTAGGAAMAGGLGLCCADCFDLAGDSDKAGGNNAPGAFTGLALCCGGATSCCVDVCDLAGDSKKRH